MNTRDRCYNYAYDFCGNNTLVSCNTTLNEETGYYYYDYECSVQAQLSSLFYEEYVAETIPLLGYILPAIAIPTLVANILVISVFVRKSMRSATTTLLVFLAISDNMNCLTIFPTNFYHYTLQNYDKYVPYDFCVFDYACYVMYRIFRTTSNWITVVLGVQRLIVVYFPFTAKSFCNIKTSAISAISCLSFAIGLHFILIIAMDIHRVSNSVTAGGSDGCDRELSRVFGQNYESNKKSIMIYYAFSGVLSRLLPCVLLVVATIMLVITLKKGHVIRDAASTADKMNAKAERISMIVLIVMFIFIVTEMQDAVNFGIYVYELAVFGEPRTVLSKEEDTRWSAFGITLSLIGYNLNFWIYILMSDRFRKEVWRTLKKICIIQTCCSMRKDDDTVTSTTVLSNRTATTTNKRTFSK